MHRNSKFKTEYYVKVYQLARSGVLSKDIAKVLGVSFITYIMWKRKRPALKQAEKEGKNSCKKMKHGKNPVEVFHEQVYQQLPDELQSLWEEINSIDRDSNGIVRIEKLLKDKGERSHQQLFIYALTALNFNYNRACRSAHVTKRRLDKWIETDPHFGELLDAIHWHKKNYYEGALLDLIERGDPAAILMVNKSVNADRGYNSQVNLNVNGKVEHEHKHVHVTVDDLDLSIDTRKTILEALRTQKAIDVQATVTSV